VLEPKKESLIIYKGQPGKIVNVDKKIDIKLADGSGKKVREKDFTLLHPGPVKSLNIPSLDCNIEEVWTLLQGESVSLFDLAEFLYGDSDLNSVYNAYLHLEENLYFSGSLEEIICNSKEFIEEVQERELLKSQKAEEYNSSLKRLSMGTWIEEDENALREIEGVVLEQRSGSKILKSLGIKESPESAHKFLIKIGYWTIENNPFPGRLGVSLKSSVKKDDFILSKNSLDLTHLKSYAIDDEGSTDPDDAISLENGNRVWVHITDVASLIPNGSNGDIDASSKGSNLYLPTETVHMLPKEVTDIQALGSLDGNNAISYMVEFDEDYNIINREVHLTVVKVSRLSYSEVESQRESEDFKPLYNLAHKLKDKREANGALTISLPEVKMRVDDKGNIDIKPIGGIESRNIVSEFMLLAGETAAIFCRDNSIPIPYATQQPPEAKGAPENNLASMFIWRRKFKRGETKYSPEPHAGLGLQLYTRATSPLRRYSDLVVNQQIRSFLLGESCMTQDEVLLKVSPSIESMKRLSVCERLSNYHWKLVYLSRFKDSIYVGTYVEKKDKGVGVLLIEDLALEVTVPMNEFPELNSKVNLKIKKIDVPAGVVTFQSC